MSDIVWQAIIAGVVTIVLAWINIRTNRTLETVHKLVNSGALAQFKINAELSRWKADQTNDPAHITAAVEAERLYQEHKSKQAAVDNEW